LEQRDADAWSLDAAGLVRRGAVRDPHRFGGQDDSDRLWVLLADVQESALRAIERSAEVSDAAFDGLCIWADHLDIEVVLVNRLLIAIENATPFGRGRSFDLTGCPPPPSRRWSSPIARSG
jgi:hypothetical protein